MLLIIVVPHLSNIGVDILRVLNQKLESLVLLRLSSEILTQVYKSFFVKQISFFVVTQTHRKNLLLAFSLFLFSLVLYVKLRSNQVNIKVSISFADQLQLFNETVELESKQVRIV